MLNSCKYDSNTITKNTNDSIAFTEHAKAIHNRVITLDTHCDINIKDYTESINYSQNLKSQDTPLKMTMGGLDVPWFIVYTGQDTLSETGFKNAHTNAMSKFDAIHKLVSDIAPNTIELALNYDDVRRITAAGKKVAMIDIKNGYSIENDITNVEKFYNLGACYMSLCHNGHS